MACIGGKDNLYDISCISKIGILYCLNNSSSLSRRNDTNCYQSQQVGRMWWSIYIM